MKKIFTSLFLFLFASLVFDISAQIIYVDSSATGMNNGTTWTDAFTDLHDALSAASSGYQIWVAAGTYTPDMPDGDPNSTFLIDVDIELLGGFEGMETSPGERDPIANKTILSGDLNGDDVDDNFENFKSDNVHTVARITSSTTNATLLDGFTIRGGHADGAGLTGENGGGIYSDGTPTIRNCTFEQNYALVNGGAMAQFDYSGSTVILDNCHLNNNSAEAGMAVYILESLFDIEACTFRRNVDHSGPFSGSALGILDPFGGRARNCTFEDNHANYGTAIAVWRKTINTDPGDVLVEILDCEFNYNTADLPTNDLGVTTLNLVTNGTNSSFVVKGCTFNQNESQGSGGAISLNFNPVSNNASMLIDSCEFHTNTAQYNGSALWARLAGDNLNLEISNCQFLQNTTTLYSAAVDLWGTSGGTGSALVDNCLFDGNISGAGGGAMWMGNVHNGGASVDFRVNNSVFRSNEVNTSGGAIAISSGSNSQTDAIIEGCEFSENKSDDIGGALRLNMGLGNAFYQIKRSTFNGNESPKGGAIYARKLETGSGEILIENTLIVENSSDSAAIFLDTLSNLTLLNTTIAENQANGIEVANGGSITLQNTILHNPNFANSAYLTPDNTIISNGGNLFGDDSFADHAIASDWQNEDPQFAGSGDWCEYYQLTPGSHAVNAGIAPDAPSDFDLCGNARIQKGQIDIGALESLHPTSAKEVIVGELKLSPNPATNFINLQLPEAKNKLNEISLFDAQGKLVRLTVPDKGGEMYVHDLSSGFYVLKAVADGHVYIGRFIKQ